MCLSIAESEGSALDPEPLGGGCQIEDLHPVNVPRDPETGVVAGLHSGSRRPRVYRPGRGTHWDLLTSQVLDL